MHTLLLEEREIGVRRREGEMKVRADKHTAAVSLNSIIVSLDLVKPVHQEQVRCTANWPEL